MIDVPASHRIPYEPALDGLRGLAVLAVVLYHAEVGWAAGGYLGVDAFFVLSGYLITTLLLAEWRTTDRIDVRQFWIRRVRRLMPALLVALVFIAALAAFATRPDLLAQIRGDGIAALTYVMNWRLIATSQSYFDQFSVSPLRHFWSLAIEEQYYLVWPLLTLAVLRYPRIASGRRMGVPRGRRLDPQTRARNDARRLFKVCAGLGLASALWMLVSSFGDALDNPSRLYYGTDTRAQSLLVGSALAAAIAAGFRLPEARRRMALIGIGIGSLLLVLAWITLTDTNALPYRGGFLLFALIVAGIVFACTQLGDNPLRAALSFEPLRALGLVSYGLYLYHFPIFFWINADRTGFEPGSLRLLVLRLTVSLVAAIISFIAIERPIRNGALRHIPLRAPWRVLISPIAIALVLALLILTTRNGAAAGPDADGVAANQPPPTAVQIPGATTTQVLLVGDSVAYRTGLGFEGAVSDRNHLAVWNQAVLFCELIDAPHMEQGEVKPPGGTCRNWESDWRSAVATFKPAVSVLELGAWEIFDREIDNQWVRFGTPEFDAILVPKLQRAIDALSSGGARVAVLTTPAFARTDAVSSKEWTINESSRTDHFNALLRSLVAANPTKATLVDLGGWICPNGVCRTEIDGIPLRLDGLHFTGTSAPLVAEWLAPQLRTIAGT